MYAIPTIAVLLAAFTIASYCATPAAVPNSRTFDYDITVPLFYNGQNVGSTVIPKGNPVEVIAETATTITIRHMGSTLTVNKPGTTPATAVKTRATETKVTAQPTKAVANTAEQAEIARMRKIPERKMPYPVMALVVESDGSYDCNFCTHDTEHLERIGTKLRVLATGTMGSDPDRIWELDDSDTIEAKMAADPKFAEGFKAYHKMIIATRGFGENYIDTLIAEKTRVVIGPSIYTVPSKTPIPEALALIVKRDPRMQSLINTVDHTISSGLISWKNAPANCEQVGLEAIAKELLDDPKSLTPAAVSLREEVEKFGVKHRRQPDNSCTTYSAYHLLDFYMKKGDISPFTFEQFKAMIPKWEDNTHRVSSNELLGILAKTQPGLKIRVRELPKLGYNQTSYNKGGCNKIYQAFLRHELAAGRPAWLGVGNHQVMMVGYAPDGKGTRRPGNYLICKGDPRITALDSTGFGDDDHGYSLWGIDDASTAMTLEFIKPPTAGK